MFSRRSQSSVLTPQTPPCHGAPISIVNSGLAFALMEEKVVASLLQKMSNAHMESMNHMMQWAKAQSSPLFSVMYGKIAEMTWMWSQILTEASEKYGSYVKILQEVFSEERAIEETHKAACFAQQQVSKAQKNLDSLKKKSDSSKHTAMQKELETATLNYEMLSKKLLDQMASVESLQLRSIRQSLSVQASLFLTVSESCGKLFATQQQLADLVPDTHSSLSNEETIKATEYSMSECIFGLAEHLDLWPPEAGGVTCLSPLKDTSGEALQSSSMSSKQMHNMRRYESECSPLSGSLQGSQESLTGLINPPALPPRSPVTNRRSRILKGEEFDRESNANNNNSRGRCQSLSLYDRKHAKKNSSKEKLVPEIKRSSQVTEDMRGWAVRWKNSRRPGSVHFGVRFGTDDQDRSNRHSGLVHQHHFQSDPDLLQSFKTDIESHYSIPTDPQANGTEEEGQRRWQERREGNGTTERSEEQDRGNGQLDSYPSENPYSTPVDALASFTPKYTLHRQTPDAYPVLKKVSDQVPPKGLLKRPFHRSADSINSIISHNPSDEGVYAVPFDAIVSHRRMRKSSSPANAVLTKDVNSSETVHKNHPNVRRSSSLSQDKYYKGEVNPRKMWLVAHRERAEWGSTHDPLPPKPQIGLPPKPTAKLLSKETLSTENQTSSQYHDYCEIDLLSEDLSANIPPSSPSVPEIPRKNSDYLFQMDILNEVPMTGNQNHHNSNSISPTPVEVGKLKSSKPKLVSLAHRR